MVKIPLVKESIEDGDRLIRTLESRGMEVTSAFWLYDDEVDRWTLVLALPFVDQNGPLPAYQEMGEIVASGDWAGLDSGVVAFWGPNEWRFQRLRERAESGKMSGDQSGKAPRVVFEDAYIYRG